MASVGGLNFLTSYYVAIVSDLECLSCKVCCEHCNFPAARSIEDNSTNSTNNVTSLLLFHSNISPTPYTTGYKSAFYSTIKLLQLL